MSKRSDADISLIGFIEKHFFVIDLMSSSVNDDKYLYTYIYSHSLEIVFVKSISRRNEIICTNFTLQ